MGSSCSKSSEIVINEPRPNKAADKRTNDVDSPKNILDKKFRDMPEWEGERYKGQGLKRMKGYKCILQIDKLNQLREEFWTEKIKENLLWRHIRQAIYLDEGQ